jgi:cytochrome c biogenesis protein CcmG/thiol:disulfide interchange protein DsbE
MRRAIVFLCTALLLTSCSLTEPIPVKGRLVGCEEIKTVAATDEALECLAGGTPISVDSIKGPAIINIWGTWCAPCREELPHFAELLNKYGDQVDVIGIAVEEKNQATVRKFVKRNGITWPILYDETGSTQEKFGPGVPVTAFINKSGKVVYTRYGAFQSLEELELATIKYFGVK